MITFQARKLDELLRAMERAKPDYYLKLRIWKRLEYLRDECGYAEDTAFALTLKTYGIPV